MGRCSMVLLEKYLEKHKDETILRIALFYQYHSCLTGGDLLLTKQDMEAAQGYMPMRSMMSMNMMPRMRKMMQNMCDMDMGNDREAKQ
jgi:hypothetical protein